MTAAVCHRIRSGSHSGETAVAICATTAFALLPPTRQLCKVDGDGAGSKYGDDIGAAVAIGEDCNKAHITVFAPIHEVLSNQMTELFYSLSHFIQGFQRHSVLTLAL